MKDSLEILRELKGKLTPEELEKRAAIIKRKINNGKLRGISCEEVDAIIYEDNENAKEPLYIKLTEGTKTMESKESEPSDIKADIEEDCLDEILEIEDALNAYKDLLVEEVKKPTNLSKTELEYKDYIEKHCAAVKKAFDWMTKNAPEIFKSPEERETVRKQVSIHDNSKWGEAEFKPYAEHFYGKNRNKDDDPDFEKAKQHHFSVNKHHYEYWLKQGKTEMPRKYIIEMLCDWWSFSINKNNLKGILNVRLRNDFSPSVRKQVIDILDIIRKHINDNSTGDRKTLKESFDGKEILLNTTLEKWLGGEK